MNKVEYLDALKVALKDTDKDIMEEIISDYEEHFQVGAENGKSEEQICEDLGSIEDLVEEIKDVYHTDKKSTKNEKKEEENRSSEDSSSNKSKFFGDWHFSFDNIKGESIGNAINSALNSAGEALSNIDVKEISKTVKKSVDEAANTINRFADDYLKNQGNPFDYSKRHAEGFNENVSKSYDDTQEEPKKDESCDHTVSFGTEPVEEEAGAIPKEEETNEKEDNKVDETKDTVDASAEEESSNIENPKKSEEINDVEVKENSSEGKVDIVKTEETIKAKVCEAENEEQPLKVEESMDSCDTQDTSESEKTQESSSAGKQLNLMVEGICADVKVKSSKNGKVNINYVNNGTEKQKQMYEFYSYKEGDTIYAGIRKVGKAVFFFNFIENSIEIDIELPDYMRNVTIKTASGNIQFDGIKADRVVAEAASGDVELSRVVTTDLKVKSSSGNVELNDVYSVQFYVNTVSGSIDSNQIVASNLTLKNVSGCISSHDVKTNIMEISSMSGSIDLLHMSASESKIRTQSGELSLNDCSVNNMDATTVSGSIRAVGMIGDGLRICSTSGSVIADVNVKRCHASSKSGSVDVTCNGELTLEASSISGGVNVHLRNYGNGYSIKSRTTSGGLYINYGEQHLRNLKTGTYTYGKESSELILSSVSGDLHVND